MNTLHSIVIIFFLSLTFSACKTQEEIQRDQMVDNIAVQVVEGQKLSAESTVQLQHLEERVAKLNGEIEETRFNTSKVLNEKTNLNDQRLSVVEKDLAEIKEIQVKIQRQLLDQKDYLDKVISSLDKISTTSVKKKKVTSKSNLSPYQDAMANYKNRRYKTAKKKLLVLLKDKKIKGKKKQRIIHNLGMIAYIQKSYQDAIILFSRLYTDYPKSGYNANGLLYLGKAFRNVKKAEEANQIWNELINKFPKSVRSKEAKKLLDKKKI